METTAENLTAGKFVSVQNGLSSYDGTVLAVSEREDDDLLDIPVYIEDEFGPRIVIMEIAKNKGVTIIEDE